MALKGSYLFIFIQISYYNGIFYPQDEYRPFCHWPVFTSKAWILTFWPLTSIEVWGQWHYIVRISIVIDQGSFHKVDNDLKFTNIWELAHFLISTESHLDRAVDFISGLTFWNRTYSESPQNFRSYDILHDHVASVLKFWGYFKHNSGFACRTV